MAVIAWLAALVLHAHAGSCLPPGADGVAIRGAEVTQSIQHFRDGRFGWGTEAWCRKNNSVGLVAYKPVLVRFYVRRERGVSGYALRVTRDAATFDAQLLNTAVPPAGRVERARRRTAETLNFVIPTKEAHGVLEATLVAELSDGGERAVKPITIDLTHTQDLELTVIPIALDGGKMKPPTLVDALHTVGWTLRAYPVSARPKVTLAAPRMLKGHLDGKPKTPDTCNKEWTALVSALPRANDDTGLIYGLVSEEVQVRGDGCATNRMAAGVGTAGLHTLLGHELGHQLGFEHVPSPKKRTLWSGHSHHWNKLPRGSIGTFGLDLGNAAARRPRRFFDIMTTQDLRWVSVERHRRIGEALRDPSSPVRPTFRFLLDPTDLPADSRDPRGAGFEEVRVYSPSGGSATLFGSNAASDFEAFIDVGAAGVPDGVMTIIPDAIVPVDPDARPSEPATCADAEVAILNPMQREWRRNGRHAWLLGTLTTAKSCGETCTWQLDKKAIGTGLDLFAELEDLRAAKDRHEPIDLTLTCTIPERDDTLTDTVEIFLREPRKRR